MIWILIIVVAIGFAYYANKNKRSSFSGQSSSYTSNTGSQNLNNTTPLNGNAFPVMPTDAMDAVACLARLFEEIDSQLAYLHLPGEIHLDVSQAKGSNVAHMFIWYFKDYDGLGELIKSNYTLSSGFSVSNNTIEYRSQNITGFRQNMNKILDVIPCYLPDARLDYDNKPTGYSDYTKEYFAHGVYRI